MNCPKCGAEPAPFQYNVDITEHACGSVTKAGSSYVQSRLCKERESHDATRRKLAEAMYSLKKTTDILEEFIANEPKKFSLEWEWYPMEADLRGWLCGQPEITLFIISSHPDKVGRKLGGAFVPDADERERSYLSIRLAKDAAEEYLAAWIARNMPRPKVSSAKHSHEEAGK